VRFGVRLDGLIHALHALLRLQIEQLHHQDLVIVRTDGRGVVLDLEDDALHASIHAADYVDLLVFGEGELHLRMVLLVLVDLDLACHAILRGVLEEELSIWEYILDGELNLSGSQLNLIPHLEHNISRSS
jgi:hypothetical protein